MIFLTLSKMNTKKQPLPGRLWTIPVFILSVIFPGSLLNVPVLATSGFPEIERWLETEPVREYNPENLHEYINGGADRYIRNGFLKLCCWEYTNDDDQFLQADLYMFNSSENAARIFKQETLSKTVDEKIGDGCYSGPNHAIFHQESYLVKLTASTAGFEIELEKAARKISASLFEKDKCSKSGNP